MSQRAREALGVPATAPKRSEIVVTKEVAAAARALALATQAWLAILPRDAVIENARSQISGLARLLTELATLRAGGRTHDGP